MSKCRQCLHFFLCKRINFCKNSLKNEKLCVTIYKLKYVLGIGGVFLARKTKNFNKKILAMLIERARGDRTTRKFASDCGISYVQLHKLERCEQENAPGLKLLKKLAENSENDVELEDFMFACGIDETFLEPKKKEYTPKSLDVQSLYDKLSQGQKKTVYDFIDYLLNYKK